VKNEQLSIFPPKEVRYG